MKVMDWCVWVVITPMFVCAMVTIAHIAAIAAATGQWFVFARSCAVVTIISIGLAAGATRELARRARMARKVRGVQP